MLTTREALLEKRDQVKLYWPFLRANQLQFWEEDQITEQGPMMLLTKKLQSVKKPKSEVERNMKPEIKEAELVTLRQW